MDEILSEYCYGEKIDILKINIGYAEKEILLSSKLLEENVESICAEISLDEVSDFGYDFSTEEVDLMEEFDEDELDKEGNPLSNYEKTRRKELRVGAQDAIKKSFYNNREKICKENKENK